MKYVEQKHRFGCAIASIAMVLGKEYGEIERLFENDFDKGGLKSDVTRDFIADHDYSVIEIRCMGYADIEEMNKRMQRPFADIHIVNVQPCADSKTNHSLVMDAKGEIFDPARPDNKSWDYYFVHHILGFFKEHTNGSKKR